MQLRKRLKQEIEKVQEINKEGIEQVNRKQRQLENERRERESVNARLEAIRIDLDVLARKRTSQNGV